MANPYKALALGQFAAGLGAGLVNKREQDEVAKIDARRYRQSNRRDKRDYALRKWLATQDVVRQEKADQDREMERERTTKDRALSELFEIKRADIGSMSESQQRAYWQRENELNAQVGRPETPFTLRTPTPPGWREKLGIFGDVKGLAPEGFGLNPQLAQQALAEGGLMPPASSQQQTPQGLEEWQAPGTAARENALTSLFVPEEKSADPNRAASALRSAEISLRDTFAYQASPEKKAMAVEAYAVAFESYTGRKPTEAELQNVAMGKWSAAQGANIDQGQQRIDETADNNLRVDADRDAARDIAQQNADTALYRAQTAAKKMETDRSKATGTTVVQEYGKLRSARDKLMEYKGTEAEVAAIDAQMKALEPAYKQALGLTGGGKIDWKKHPSVTKWVNYTGEKLSPFNTDRIAKWVNQEPDGTVDQLISEIRAEGFNDWKQPAIRHAFAIAKAKQIGL